MSYRSTLLALALASAVSPTARAQSEAPAPNPYRVLYVSRESVKPGKVGAHNKLEAQWAKAAADAKMPLGILALSAITGPREIWFVSGFPSYAEFSRMGKAMDDLAALSAVSARMEPQEGDLLSDARGMTLQVREDLSYGTGPSLATMRFFSITRASVRPGHVSEFEDARKMIKQAHETAKVSDSFRSMKSRPAHPLERSTALCRESRSPSWTTMRVFTVRSTSQPWAVTKGGRSWPHSRATTSTAARPTSLRSFHRRAWSPRLLRRRIRPSGSCARHPSRHRQS